MNVSALAPDELAEQRTREVLLTQPQVTQLVIDSPPGAGKTGLVERLAVQGAWLHGERVVVATQTNGQSFDLALRLAAGWPERPVHLFVRRGLPRPEQLSEHPNLAVVTSLRALPEGPQIVIANAAKWSYAEEHEFDLMIVDEAYQLRDAQFVQIAGLTQRHILVGDPGQIAPVVSADVSRWQNLIDGPHRPAPQALLARRPQQTLRLALPVSRRLPADTVRYIQPAFYPQLPFEAVAAPDERRLMVEPGADHRWDAAIDLAGEGASLMLAELPARVTGEFDDALAGEMVALIRRLVERQAVLHDDGQEIMLSAEQVGVVCGHRSQVYAVQEQLGAELSAVHVETADRYQGLERRVMLVHHPLSGRLGFGDFQLDSGRLCVMTSRHRVACFMLARAGLGEQLGRLPPSVERVLGVDGDPTYSGRVAHQRLLEALARDGRTISLGR